MTRPPRGEEEGAIHHAVPQGNGRRRIVVDDRDRRAYMARFQRVGRELGWFESAGCLMDTHHHTVVETTEPNLGLGMQRVQGGHSRWLNARHGREGQVFRHRFWSKRVLDEAWFFRACIYVVVNPSQPACAAIRPTGNGAPTPRRRSGTRTHSNPVRNGSSRSSASHRTKRGDGTSKSSTRQRTSSALGGSRTATPPGERSPISRRMSGCRESRCLAKARHRTQTTDSDTEARHRTHPTEPRHQSP